MPQKNWFKPGKQLQLATTVFCLQAFTLFGFDQGIFSGIISNPDFLKIFNNPSPDLLGLIVSIYNAGCFFGCILNMRIGGILGRRKSMWLALTLISVGAILQASSFSTPHMMIGRVLTGLGTGIETSTVPMYQSELCAADKRGRLVVTEVLFTGLGVVIAYFITYGLSFTDGPISWRLQIALQIIFAIFAAVLLFGLPDSPRWLIQKGRTDEAVAAMSKVYDLPEDDPYIQGEKDNILNAIALEEGSSAKWTDIFKSDAVHTRKRAIIACTVLFMNQLAGINVVVFYAPTVLQVNVGLSRNTSLIVGGFVNLAFVVGSLIPSLFLDKIGRKKPMMAGAFGMGISMMMIAIMLSFKGTVHEGPTATASIAFFFTFMICFGASLNGIPWCYSTEILPLKFRGPGTALAVSNNWLWVFFVVYITPVLINDIAWKTYLIFMACNFAFVPIIYFFFVETKGLSLEEIDFLFMSDADRVEHARGGGGIVSETKNTGVSHVEHLDDGSL